MAFAFTLDSTVPAEGGLVSAGAGNIRNLTAALIERLNSFFVDANTSPLTGKASGVGFGQAPEANNTIAIRGLTSDATSNILLGRNASGVTKFAVDSNGLGTFVGGLTVSAGSTSVQALTCTTLGPSGAITSSATGSLFARSGASTAAQYVDLSNTTGRLLLGVESSAGGQLIVASTGYATCLTSVGATVLQLGTNQGLALTISTAQLVTVASGLVITAGGLTVTAGLTSIADGIRQTGTQLVRVENTAATRPASSTGAGIEFAVSGGNAFIQGFNATSVALIPVQFNSLALLINTSVATGATTGDVVLPNLGSIRGVNAAGSTTLALLSVDASNQTTLNLNSAKLVLVNAVTSSTASVGPNTLPAGCAGYLTVVMAGNTNKIPFYAN